MLIGDPKQAIYAFRGADVYAYLDAARSAVVHATLQVNWRSDQGLIDAYDALFDGAQLGHEGIVYRRVLAAEANRAPRLTGAGAPLRVRVVHRDEPAVERTPRGLREERVRARVHRPRPRGRRRPAARRGRGDRDAAPTTAPWRAAPAVAPGDVAVLVRTNRAAAAVRDALDAAGVPAVINGAGQRVRDRGRGPLAAAARGPGAARLRPARARRRAHAVPRLAGGAGRVRGGGRSGRSVHRRLHAWARVLRLRGVAALAETVSLAQGLPARVLSRPDGERELTDLRHVAQLLHAAATTEQLGTTALGAWLRRRIAEAADDTADEERSRRLESDADAVQVLTVHRSKGLEFPIVYFPDLWEPGYIPRSAPVVFHDPAAGDRRTIDVGMEGATFERHKEQALVEQRGEDLRLAYVALTRARHQAVVWWAGTYDSRDSALGRMLFARGEDGAIAATGNEHADRQQGRRALRGARRRRAGPDRRRARPAGPPGGLGRAAARPGRADRVALRPRARPALAPHVLQRHHRRGARGAGGERARRGRHRRRAGARDPAAGRPRRRRGAARGPVAARGDAGRGGHRHVRARRPRGGRLRRARPDRGADRAGRRGARAAPARDRRRGDHGRGAARGARDAARPARRRPAARRRRARRPARRAGLRAAAGRRRPAERPRHARRDRRRARRAPAARATRSRATRRGCATPRCGATCAAT